MGVGGGVGEWVGVSSWEEAGGVQIITIYFF